MLFLDGVYAEDYYGLMRFHRVTWFLENKGWRQRDDENAYVLR
jgi:hypothetical protein